MNKFTILILLDVLYQVTSNLSVPTKQNDSSKHSVIPNLTSTFAQTPAYFSSEPTVTKLQSKPQYENDSNLLQPRNILVDILKSPIEQILDYLIGALYVINNIIKNQQNSATLSLPAPKKTPIALPKAIIKPAEKILLAPVIKIEEPIPKNDPKKSPLSAPINKPLPPIVKKPIQPITKKPRFTTEPTYFQNSIFLSSLGDLIGLGNTSHDPPINAKVADRIPTQQPGATVTVEGKNNSIYVDNNLRYPNDEIFKNQREVCIRIRSGDFYVNNNLVLKKGRSDHDHVFYSTHELNYQGVSYFVLKIYSDGKLQYHDNKGNAQNINYYTPVLSFGLNRFNFF